MNILKYFSLSALLCLTLFSCKDDEIVPERPGTDEASAYTQKVTGFIYDYMSYYYLWNDQIPNYNLKYETNPFDYFNKICSPQDPWSFLVDDRFILDDEYNNIQYTYGLNLDLLYFDDVSDRIIGIIQYTDPNTPAAKAGLQRGEIITAINDQTLTDKNYETLLTGNTMKASVAYYKNGLIINHKVANLNPAEVEINPIHTAKTLEEGQQRIGYLLYTGYFPKYNRALNQIFTEFSQNNITDLVLDLRYNLGGYDESLSCLCSSVAPLSAVENKAVIVRDRYNTNLQQEFDEALIDPSVTFADTDVNLNLKRIYILTSGNTYSASEATIIGLMPYMDVILIGEQTGGKYASAWVLQPEIQSGNDIILDPEIKNWAIQAIVARFENANGLTFQQGVIPNHWVSTLAYENVKPLGDPSEPLLAKALELITGQAQPARLHAKTDRSMRYFKGYTSPRDEQKQVLIKKSAFRKTK